MHNQAARQDALRELEEISLPSVTRALEIVKGMEPQGIPAPAAKPAAPAELLQQARQLLTVDYPLAVLTAGQYLRALQQTLIEAAGMENAPRLTPEGLLAVLVLPPQSELCDAAFNRVVYRQEGKMTAVELPLEAGRSIGPETPVPLRQSAPLETPPPLSLDKQGLKGLLTRGLNLAGTVKREYYSRPSVDQAVLSPDGSLLAAAHTILDRHGFPVQLIESFDLAADAAPRSWSYHGEIRAMQFVPGANRLLVALESDGLSGRQTIIEVRNLDRLGVDHAPVMQGMIKLGRDVNLSELCVSPDGRRIAVLTSEPCGAELLPRVRSAELPAQGPFRTVDLSRQPVLLESAHAHLLKTRGLHFAPSGDGLFVSASDRRILQIPLAPSPRGAAVTVAAQFPWSEADAAEGCIGAGGRSAAVCSRDGLVSLYLQSDGVHIRSGSISLPGGVRQVLLSPDDGRLLVKGEREVRVYDVRAANEA